jgi:hypothetical protein
MPNVYANVTELLEVGELKEGDFVMIGKTKCKMCWAWVHTSDKPNGYVIDDLGLDKVKLAAAFYGYAPLAEGAFPNSKDRDYPALTRFTAVLMALTELKDVNTKHRADMRKAKEAEIARLKDILCKVDHEILQLQRGPF